MCIFKSQLIDKGTNKVTKENVQENKSVQFDTSSARFDLAIKEVEERVKLGWSVKSSFLLGGGYIRVDYVRADPNRYKDVGKTSESAENTDSESLGYGGLGSVGCEESVEEATEVESAKEVVAKEVNEAPVKDVVKPVRKTTTTTKKSEVKDD